MYFWLQKIEEHIPVIKPDQKFKVLWDIVIFFIILFYFFIIPLQLGFDFIQEESVLEHLLSFGINHHLAEVVVFFPEFLLIVDSLLKFITGYYENGLVVTSKAHIVKHYIKKGLIFDLLSYCPVIFQSLSHQSTLSLKLLQLLMFLKIKRIKIIVGNFQEMISLKGQDDHILSLLKMLLQIIFFAHLSACIWHSVAYYNHSQPNWLECSQIKDSDLLTRYFHSFFWAVSCLVTIGFGDKTGPQNNVEFFCATVIFLISSIYFGYNINCMREILDLMNKKEKDYK